MGLIFLNSFHLRGYPFCNVSCLAMVLLNRCRKWDHTSSTFCNATKLPNGFASLRYSQRKYEKPELAYGLSMGGQTDSQVGSQVYASLLAINLCRLALGGQTVKTSSVIVSPRKWVAKRNAGLNAIRKRASIFLYNTRKLSLKVPDVCK